MSIKELMLAGLLAAGVVPYALATAPVVEETASAEASESTDAQEGRDEAAFLASLNFQKGKVSVGDKLATFNLPENLVFLDSQDAERVLVEAWGNPPSDPLPLGMILPAGVSPLAKESWAVTVEYEESGYVSDEDAEDIDYSEMLEQMQDDSQAENQWRSENGYEPVTLVGWAAAPHYDAAGKKLHWAKELKFGEAEQNTLNYNIRVLGRKGVLILNFIANMDQLPDIQAHLPGVLAMTEFDEGNRYADFDPDLDEVAAYGLGALIAGKVAAKAGLLAAGLLLLKKFFFVPLALGGWLISRVRRKKAATEAQPVVPPAPSGPDLSKKDETPKP